jgi:DNA-binding MarR family transcriptional regulator
MHERGNEQLIAELQGLMHAIAFGRAAAPPEAWLQTDLSMGQLCALLVLQHGGSARVGALASALHMSPNATTAVVDRLEEAGLVERGPDPRDRRAVLVQPSSAGTDTIEQLMSAGTQQLEGRLRQLAVGDLQALWRGVTALLRVMEQEQAQADAAARTRRRAG